MKVTFFVLMGFFALVGAVSSWGNAALWLGIWLGAWVIANTVGFFVWRRKNGVSKMEAPLNWRLYLLTADPYWKWLCRNDR